MNRRWRPVVVAAVLALVGTWHPAPGVRAAEVTVTYSALVGGVLSGGIAAPTSPPADLRPAFAAGIAPLDVVVAAPRARIAPRLAALASTSPPSSGRTTASAAAVPAAAQPATLWAQLRDGLTVTGMASWYPGTSGYAGVAHVAMPGARYLPPGTTGPRVRVCADGRCVVVPVVDFCDCHVGTRQARVVDLSAGTLARLGLDPDVGVYRVQLTLAGR